MSNVFEKLKRRLNITAGSPDEIVLQDILEDAESAFKVVTGANEIDSKYDFMIIQVASKLYNRRGSEGMESENVDGYSVKYIAGLYDEFMPILERDFNLNDDEDKRRKGRVMVY